MLGSRSSAQAATTRLGWALSIAVLASLPWTLTASGLVRREVLPPLGLILRRGAAALVSTHGALAVAVSLGRLAASLVISVAAALVLAVAASRFRLLRASLSLPVDFLRSIPVVTLFPIFVALWGFREPTYLAVPVSLGATYFYVHLLSGIDGVDRRRTSLMERWGASSVQTFVHLTFPSVARHAIGGLRLVVSLQLILVLVAEMFFGASTGLGSLIADRQTLLRYEEMYFFIGFAGLIGWLLNLSLRRLELRFPSDGVQR